MAYTVLITETNCGYATFETEEEATEWMQEPDYGDVKWTDNLDSNFELVTDQ